MARIEGSSTSLTPLDLLRPSCPDCRHSREAGIQLLQASNMDPRFREDDSLVWRKSPSIEREFGLIIGAIAAIN